MRCSRSATSRPTSAARSRRRSGPPTAAATIETLLAEASQALSGLSRGAGVVLAGKTDIRLKHIEFIRLEPTRALVVLVGEDGSVENRLIDLDPGTTPSALIEAANYLNAHLRGRTLSEARAETATPAERSRAPSSTS